MEGVASLPLHIGTVVVVRVRLNEVLGRKPVPERALAAILLEEWQSVLIHHLMADRHHERLVLLSKRRPEPVRRNINGSDGGREDHKQLLERKGKRKKGKLKDKEKEQESNNNADSIEP
eukprot:gnl/MRDRNA2_/MRDRNA2_54496_c0_seq1.p1 gnl/MRDRNA2_/MRDRNA2_54496_c0~~gnl/MRDRNA2_/MRDRNA2_54496_c0_seq1.p1  ORF type:complete len:119 (+),score=17.37 gnl/MRDRNA2_/MRDRNA2_54496_c0_seq1:96-452(+)